MENLPEIIEIRCEIFISKEDFKKLKNNFANPRNAAGGSLRQKILMKPQKSLLNILLMGSVL